MKLPPMNALRAFEAVSRHGSVSKAADELCVTQGAVSQQLRNLEDHLGRELFVRSPNSIALSEEGEAFAEVVQKALTEIAAAADSVSRTPARQCLTVSMAPGMAIKWILPRLGDFYRLHPDITVLLDQSVDMVSFKNDGVDAAIRFSDGRFDDLDSVFLFRPRLYAVASPGYLEKHGNLETLAQPGTHQLIDYQFRGKEIRAQHVHWEDVVADGQIDPQTPLSIFPDEFQSFSAALQGRGIALAADYLISAERAAGEILLACGESIPARFSYYFVWPADARPNPAREAFLDWLLTAFVAYRED